MLALTKTRQSLSRNTSCSPPFVPLLEPPCDTGDQDFMCFHWMIRWAPLDSPYDQIQSGRQRETLRGHLWVALVCWSHLNAQFQGRDEGHGGRPRASAGQPAFREAPPQSQGSFAKLRPEPAPFTVPAPSFPTVSFPPLSSAPAVGRPDETELLLTNLGRASLQNSEPRGP